MENKLFIMNKCVNMIKSFDPITHSIDSHCTEHLGEINSKVAKPENVFIHQVIYGWYRERAVIEGFINSFYKDNSHCVARSDRIIYTVLAYLAIFRLDELGFYRFKEYAMTQNPTKVFYFASYLFNKTNLWGCLRAEWMKVRDLGFVENEIIAGVEQYIPELTKFCDDLNQQAQDIAASEAAKEAAKKAGTVGLKQVEKRNATRPTSPNINRPRLHLMPEPERINQSITANPVPKNLHAITMEGLEKMRKESLDAERARVTAQYGEKHEFNLSETRINAIKTNIDELKMEMEGREAAKLAFDKKCHNHPPDFSKEPARIRSNAAAILREDALFRKQQEKDRLLLRKYEEELRDTSDYFLWQQEMRSKDNKQKLDLVVLRREMAKQSAEEARLAMLKQKEDNKLVADLLREQGDAISEKLQIEEELELLHNQEVARKLQEIRDSKPKEAAEKVLNERKLTVEQMNLEIEEKLKMKADEEREDEERKTDRIRQLRAANTIHKPFVKIFDPATHAGTGFLDEMSYAEMQERQALTQHKEKETEATRRHDILEEKHKKAKEMEARAANIMRARQIKAVSNQALKMKKNESKQREEREVEEARQKAAVLLNAELMQRKEATRLEQETLAAEGERVRRQQQYLGAAMGAVEEMRELQQLMARDRQASDMQRQTREDALRAIQAKKSDQINRDTIAKRIESAHELDMKQREELFQEEKHRSIQILKEKTLINKQLFKSGVKQFELTKSVIVEHNPYASRITEESLNTVRMSRSGGGTKTGSTKLLSAAQSSLTVS